MAAAGRTHPHAARLGRARLAEVLADREPALRRLYLDVHALVRETLPDVEWSTDLTDGMTSYGVRQYGYAGWGMAALSAHTRWVSLGFLRGAGLPDPSGLLEGSGKSVRHVKIRSHEEFAEHRAAIGALIDAAAHWTAPRPRPESMRG